MRHLVPVESKTQNIVIRQIAAALVLLTMGVGYSHADDLSQWKTLAAQGNARAETHLAAAYYLLWPGCESEYCDIRILVPEGRRSGRCGSGMRFGVSIF